MYISPSWAIALAVAGAMGVVIALAVAARRGLIAAPERPLTQVAYLLGGGVAGFLALAFPPAWPLLAAVLGMLSIQAFRMKRTQDTGLLLAGFGATWALMGGLAVLNDLSDPAVSSPGAAFRFALGIVGLAGGVFLARPRRGQVRWRPAPRFAATPHASTMDTPTRGGGTMDIYVNPDEVIKETEDSERRREEEERMKRERDESPEEPDGDPKD